MGTPGQSWPFKPSVSAQVDYWGLDITNLAITDDEKERRRLQALKNNKAQKVKKNTPVRTLEKDMFSNNKVARLEDDFWGKNKKKPKPKQLNSTEKILKRII